jgi:hypothetical protein
MELLDAILSASRRGWKLTFEIKEGVLSLTARKGDWVADAKIAFEQLAIMPEPGQWVGSHVMEITDDARCV